MKGRRHPFSAMFAPVRDRFSMRAPMSIVVKNLSKQFGTFKALDAINLEAHSGSLLALLGPSGSGKTTLLRIIAGLETADSGTVLYENEDVTHQSPRDRQVGFVFQHYALFRHMSVFENVAFGMRVRHRPTAEIKARVNELLKLVRLDGLSQRYPSQLSGGQRQRVALARALAVQPRILLLVWSPRCQSPTGIATMAASVARRNSSHNCLRDARSGRGIRSRRPRRRHEKRTH